MAQVSIFEITLIECLRMWWWWSDGPYEEQQNTGTVQASPGTHMIVPSCLDWSDPAESHLPQTTGKKITAALKKN